MKKDVNEFCDRISKAIELAGGPMQFSKKAGLSRSVLDKYTKGESDPSRLRLISMAEAANVSFDWLATGRGLPYEQAGFSDAQQEAFSHSSDDLIRIPILNVMASAGGGSVVTSEDTEGFIGFEQDWFHKVGLKSSEIFTMPTIGESMEPTIKAGEYLLCSRAEHHTKVGDGIYVVRLEGNVLVKRLQVLPGGILEVSSDNSQFYKPFTLNMKDEADFVILGKVVFVHGIRRI